jgi:hypothetical protein
MRSNKKRTITRTILRLNRATLMMKSHPLNLRRNCARRMKTVMSKTLKILISPRLTLTPVRKAKKQEPKKRVLRMRKSKLRNRKKKLRKRSRTRLLVKLRK